MFFQRAKVRFLAVVAAIAAVGLLAALITVARRRLQVVSELNSLRTACERGDGVSCQRLGWEYEQGGRVDPDVDRARGYYQRACDAGYGLGCFFAGTLSEGHDDPGQVRDLYRRACRGGSPEGCTAQRRFEHQRPPR